VLAATSPGVGGDVSGDEGVWQALSRVGAEPVEARLEAQLLLAAEERRHLEELDQTWPSDNASPTFTWHALGGTEYGLLVVRVSQAGRGLPAALAASLEEWADRGPIYRTYVARFPGIMSAPAMERSARRIISLLGGQVREGVVQERLVSLAGYSPRLGPGRRTVAGTLLNLQVALRPNPGAGGTLVYVGVPLLPHSY
jgi:hypothetical protein